MQWGGEKEFNTLLRHYDQTGEMPPALANRPVLSPHNEIYYEAFMLLSSGRQNTDHVINPITFTDVMLYCDCIGVYEGEERLRYWQMVNAADQGFTVALIDRRKAEAKLAAAKAQRKTPALAKIG